MKSVPACMLGLVSCVLLAAQDTGDLKARQLYYKSKSAPDTEQKSTQETATEPAVPPPVKSTTTGGSRHRLKTTSSEKPKTAAGTAPLGLKYTVEQKDSSGNYVQVDPEKGFATGDRIRLRVEVNADAYVYLLSRGASGEGNFLFPERGEDNRLKAFQAVQVPAEPAPPIEFSPPAGTETLYITVSRSPVPELERSLPARGSPGRPQASNGAVMVAEVPSGQLQEFVGHAERLQSRDLIRAREQPESDTGSSGTNEHAVYVVNVSAAPGAQVLQTLQFKHR